MEQALPLLADQFDDLLNRLPHDLDLDDLARQTKAIERDRKVGSGITLLRLALARGPGGLSLSATAAWATTRGLPELSDPGIKYRLDKSVDFLEAVMRHQLAALSAGASVRWPGRVLRASDGTCISKRGSTGTDWRVHAVYDLGRGGFSHLELTDGHGSEAIDRGASVAGEVRIGDRAYGTAPSLNRFRKEAADGADFIVRVRWRGFNLHRPGGQDFDLIDHLATLPNDMAPHEVSVVAKAKQPLALRLIIQRKTPEAAEATRKKLRCEASRKQTTLDPRSLVAAEFMILATSLPNEYLAQEILAVYRLRWQIELAFKRLKSLLHIDRLPTWTAQASRSWLYAHLIMALLCDDLSQDFLDIFPSGSDRPSLSPVSLADPRRGLVMARQRRLGDHHLARLAQPTPQRSATLGKPQTKKTAAHMLPRETLV